MPEVAWTRSYARPVDLSGFIFAALAVGWAVYLIPKMLQHHEDLAKTRSVDSFSPQMRVLGSGRPAPVQAAVTTPADAAPAPAPTPAPTPKAPTLTREAARRAARRRRHVLLTLVFALGMVGALAGFAIAPLWAPAIPAGLILLFLVTARMSVRQQQRARVVVPQSVAAAATAEADADEDTAGVAVSEIREEVAAEEVAPALADEGSLWDPLPLTLPTYVTKPTARRTVRTIELTAGVTSSGHDAADSTLVKQAKAAEEAARKDDSQDAPEQRKAAGA